MQPENQVFFQSYPDIVTHGDLCEMLHISRNSAYRLLKSGQIKHIQMGKKYLIPKANISKYICNKLG